MGRIVYTKRQPISQKKLDQLRKTMLRTMYLDMQLFGYPTETVKSLAAQIRREKQSARPHDQN